MLEGEGGDIPDAVREVVSARVARLPAQCAEIVSTASVLGDPNPQLREAVADVRRHCDVERLRLEGLPEDDVRFLLMSSLGADASCTR
jgi:hypothetical protein